LRKLDLWKAVYSGDQPINSADDVIYRAFDAADDLIDKFFRVVPGRKPNFADSISNVLKDRLQRNLNFFAKPGCESPPCVFDRSDGFFKVIRQLKDKKDQLQKRFRQA
jgi:hypothetical protein